MSREGVVTATGALEDGAHKRTMFDVLKDMEEEMIQRRQDAMRHAEAAAESEKWREGLRVVWNKGIDTQHTKPYDDGNLKENGNG